MNHLRTLFKTCLAYILLLPVLVNAACESGQLCNPLKNDMGFWELIEFLVRDILVEIIAPIVITLMLLWSGFMFISAQGNKEKLATAKRNFAYVIVGAVLLLGAYVILSVVLNTVAQLTG